MPNPHTESSEQMAAFLVRAGLAGWQAGKARKAYGADVCHNGSRQLSNPGERNAGGVLGESRHHPPPRLNPGGAPG